MHSGTDQPVTQAASVMSDRSALTGLAIVHWIGY